VVLSCYPLGPAEVTCLADLLFSALEATAALVFAQPQENARGVIIAAHHIEAVRLALRALDRSQVRSIGWHASGAGPGSGGRDGSGQPKSAVALLATPPAFLQPPH